jgi:protein TonB
MRFCPVHGTELGPPAEAPAWERTTEVNQVLKAPDTTRNLAAAGMGGQVDTHPSGMLLEVPRVSGVTSPAEARDTSPVVSSSVTTPSTRPIQRRGVGLAAVAGLALVGLSAGTVVGGWYMWKRIEGRQVAAVPAPELLPPEADPAPEAGVAPAEPAPQPDPVEPAPAVEPEPTPEAAPAVAAPEPRPASPPAPAAASPGSEAPKAGSGGGDGTASPSSEGGAARPGSASPAKTTPAAPAGPVRMGPAELDARARRRAQPKYPDKLRERGVRGVVVVDVVVDTDGDVESARAVSGPQELHKPAVKAARKWKFSPSAQRISGTLRFNFQ